MATVNEHFWLLKDLVLLLKNELAATVFSLFTVFNNKKCKLADI